MPNATLEMACLFTDHEAPADLTGSLTTVAELLNRWIPASFSWRTAGRSACRRRRGFGVNLDVAGELALCMATRLLGEDQTECKFEFPTELGVCWPLPFACPGCRRGRVWRSRRGCRSGAGEKLDSLSTTLRACGKRLGPPSGPSAWPGRRCGPRACWPQQATLEASHVEAANGAILEREERIRQKLASDARMNAV